MKPGLRIIHIEDTALDSELLRHLLDASFDLDLHRVENERELDAALQQPEIDLIISDFTLPSYGGNLALAQARLKRPEIPFIFFSGTIGEEAAVETLKSGATDYVLKHRPQKLLHAIERALRERNEREARAEAEGQYKSLFENSLEGICRIAADWSLLTANPALAEILGYSSVEDLLTNGRHIAIAPEDLAHIRRVLAAGGVIRNQCCQARRKDSSIVWLEVNLRAVPRRDGPEPYLDGFIRDVSQRISDQEELACQAALLNEAHDAIVLTDGMDIVRLWNKGAEHLYGWTQEEVLGKRSSDVMPLAPGAKQNNSYHAPFEKGRWEGEITHLTRDQRQVIVMSRRTLLRDSTGEPKAILILNSDITDKKQTEEQFLRAQRLECIGVLAGGIAHDLNNILAPVMMGAELLKTHIADPEAQRLIETIEHSSYRGSEIVKQVLSFARGIKAQSTRLNLRIVIDEVAKFLRQTFPKTIEFQVRVPEPVFVTANVTELHQVLLNLCVNARDAMPEGGLLQIGVTKCVIDAETVESHPGWIAGNFARITVSDTGTGIPEEAFGKIFDPFFTTKEEGRGTGLGLPTVLNLVKRQGGFINVQTAVGDGTTFHVYLPTEIQEPEIDRKPLSDKKRGHGENILLVDDETAILEMTRVILEDANYIVSVASDGVQALRTFRRSADSFELIITDTGMPLMDGAALTNALREIRPTIPIICTTGEASERHDCPSGGAIHRYLAKPYSAEQIVALVADVLQEQGRSGARRPSENG